MQTPSTSAELDDILSTAGTKLVVCDYSATWCPQCKKIAPFFAKLPGQYPDVIFVSCDVDALSTHPEVIDVSGVPTFKYYINRKMVAQFSGPKQKLITTNIDRFRPKST